MAPTLIVLALIAMGVGIVLWATRRKPAGPVEQRLDQDTAWNDPVAPAQNTAQNTAQDPAPPFPPADPSEPRP
jgi:hypothetical protein